MSVVITRSSLSNNKKNINLYVFYKKIGLLLGAYQNVLSNTSITI